MVETGPQTLFGIAGSRNPGKDIRLKFITVMRRCSSNVFVDLGPHIFLRIKLRSCDRKEEDVQTFLLSDKLTDHLAPMNRMSIDNQHQGSRHDPQELLQEGDHLCSSQRMPIRLNAQLYLSALRRNQQRSQQIETLVVGDAGPSLGGLPSPRPSPLQWRHHGKASFILQSEGSAQLARLFLSSATLPPSTWRSLHHPAAAAPVEAVGCSSPSAASRAKRRWWCNELQTAPRSHAQSGPRSSNLRRNRTHTPLDPEPFPAAAPVLPTISWAAPAVVPPSSWGVSLHTSTVEPPAWLRSTAPQLPGSSSPVGARPNHVAGLRPVVHLSLFVSCPHYDTTNDYRYSKINRSMVRRF